METDVPKINVLKPDGENDVVSKDKAELESVKTTQFFIGEKETESSPVKLVESSPDEEWMPEAPDGGWGWVIVIASFFSNMIVDGIIFTFGVLMEPIQRTSGGLQTSTISWVGSLLAGFYLIAGPFVSALSNRFGFRAVAIFGSILASSGFTIGWALCRNGTNIIGLYVFYGIIGGIGFGFVYVPSIIMVGFYFEKKRAMATGIAICGSGIGTFIFAPLVQTLVDKFGWETTVLILAAIALLCGLLAILYRPLKPKGRINRGSIGTIEGTPLLVRMKRAREMQQLDSSVNLVGEVNADWKTRKISTQSFQIGQQMKRPSSPSLISQDPSFMEMTKSFIGIILPDLKEIEEEQMTEKQYSNEAKEFQIQKIDDNANEVLISQEPTIGGDKIEKERKITVEKFRADDVLFYSGSLIGIPAITERLQRGSLNCDVSSVEQGNDFICIEKRTKKEKSKLLDFSLLLSPTFVILAISGMLTLLAFFVPFMYLPGLAGSKLGEKGDTSFQVNFLISIIGISNTVGRVVCGVVADRPGANALIMNNGALALGGIATIFVPFLNKYSFFAVYAVIFGLSIASFASLRSILVVELLGLQNLTNAFGLLCLFQGIAAILGAPIAGMLRDAYDSYDVSFYVAGTLLLFSGLICFPVHYIQRWETRRNEAKRNN